MVQEILISSAFFSAIVLLLVALVLAARHWLSPVGSVTVTVNGRALRATCGRNLLRVLGDNEIYLPSPCGGKGMCGQCKVVMVNGTSTPLPTELAHLTRRETRAGVRLACSNRIRDDLQLQIPEQYLRVKKRLCAVVSAKSISTYLREVTLALPEGERLAFRAGQYILLYAPAYELRFHDLLIDPAYRDIWERTGLLALESHVRTPVTRAYSLSNSPQTDDKAALIVRIALPPPDAKPGIPPGQVSSYVFGVKPGDLVEIAGPFGDFQAQEGDREMVLIAGGAGIAPMRSIVLDQLEGRKSMRNISLWYGVRNLNDLCYAEEFATLAAQHDNFKWEVSLSEPQANTRWRGHTGFIHSVVYDHYLAAHPAPEELEYYLCGPPVMSLAVINMLEDLGVDKSSIFLDDFGSAS